MNAARDTTNAISQGLALGSHAEAGFGRLSTALEDSLGGKRFPETKGIRFQHVRFVKDARAMLCDSAKREELFAKLVLIGPADDAGARSTGLAPRTVCK
jgi:hypothetical protein